MPLYHYTCRHHHEAILADHGGVIRPAIVIAKGEQKDFLRRNVWTAQTSQVVWLTTIPHLTYLNRQLAGLGMDTVLPPRNWRKGGRRPCDRTEFRWEITEEDVDIVPWDYLRAWWPAGVVHALESAPGVRPSTWWVSRGPLRARFAPHHTDLEAVP